MASRLHSSLMPPPAARQIADPLWHCLCPSFRSNLSRLTRASQAWRPRLVQRRQTSSQHHQLRRQGTGSAIEKAQVSARTARQQQQDGVRLSRDESFEQQRQLYLRKYKDAPVSQLQVALCRAAARGDRQRAWDLVEILVADRGVKPDAQHYARLIEANCAIYDGSLDEVQRLLEEMEEQEIKPDRDVYEALLKTLAIHPSYILRAEVVNAMRESGLAVGEESQAHIVCGLLRERQIEMALEELDNMKARGVRPPYWLVDVMIHVLADIREFDEMYPLLLARSRAPLEHPSQILYSSVLMKAARSLHHPTVRFIWFSEVVNDSLNPSSGLCTAVLDTAARAGDVDLATDVFRLLSERSTALTAYQYEALVEAHLASASPDLQKVFSIIMVMKQSGSMTVTDHTTRPIFEFLREIPEGPQNAFELLRTLKEAGHDCPVEIANSVLDAAVYQGELDWAFEAYKQLHKVAGSGSDNEATVFTFNVLLRGCYKAHRKSLAMFVAAEMVALKVAPDALTYDRLILASMHGNEGAPDAPELSDPEREEQDLRDLDDAFEYLTEMKDRGWWPRKGTLNLLGLKAIECRDNRVDRLIDWMESLGTDADLIKESLYRRR